MADVAETFLYRHQKRDCPVCCEVFGSGPVTFYRKAMASITTGQEARNHADGIATNLSLKADLANAEATNRRLRQQVRALERRLAAVLGTNAEAHLTIEQQLTQDVDPVSERRLRELHDRVQQLEVELADRDEQLEAARRLNQTLMRQANAPASSTP